jgi:hypothetical protein
VKNTESVKVPPSPWCLAPLIKFQAALCVASNVPMGIFRNISVGTDGGLKVVEVKIEDLGSTNVTVPAGSFPCRRLRLSPESALMSALMPPGEMFIAESGLHPMVKTVLSATRLGPTIVTELESYKTENQPAP